VNRDAVITATSPESLSLIGIKLHSDASRQAITTQKPFISSPFTSATGNYLIFLSQPLIKPDGNYLGYIGCTIFLKKQSMLSDILSLHIYARGSSVTLWRLAWLRSATRPRAIRLPGSTTAVPLRCWQTGTVMTQLSAS
ncbi:PDC sensor domain-containing protein, partial [Pantoea rodasii]|uniref:PDC sensor domain-containing protein n=1 Tax=Pantoea rodasii TaxID=1076549 RepID=UPI001F0C6A7A